MDKFHQWSRLQVNTAKCKIFYIQNNPVAFCDTIVLPIRYLGVPWAIRRVIAECRTLNRANNGTNQFYVTSNNLKSKRIKTKPISIIKTVILQKRIATE